MSCYKVSAELLGHSLDVRGVALGPEGCILSASRDATAKLWHPQGVRDFTNVQTYRGHTNFVSSVCFLGPCESYPEGLVVTASNDKTICGYQLQEPSPVVVLKGHENTVCCVVPGQAPGTVLSASWDSTARVWSIETPNREPLVLKGHVAVVWAVIQLDDGRIATGSADKSIFIWSHDGKKINTLTGHTDCIRGLTTSQKGTFLSCANDALIKLWSNDGQCLKTFFGHSNYVYSICRNPLIGEDCFVSCGEDSTIRVWSGGEIVSTISLPAQSVWCVTCTLNGDIVAGSSDGIVRVFTKDESRIAEQSVVANFEECVAKHIEAVNQEIGGYKVADLPGPESLLESGKNDGQTKLVRFGTKVKCYSWSGSLQKWTELGEVTGAAKTTEGKETFEGKEYDYVFNVDIEDGKPPLKLPYNVTEDPWITAQNFIHKNFLPQSYLEQVANFIIKNSKKGNVVQTSGNSEYVDPFTGGTRYVPNGSNLNNSFKGQNADPFTGSSSYSTSNSSNTPQNKLPSTYFPQKTYLRFDQANVPVITNKLMEFNEKLPNQASKMSENDISSVTKLTDEKSLADSQSMEKLKIMLEWPDPLLFPVLDILRLAVRNKVVNEYFFNNNDIPILEMLLRHLSSDSPPANQLLVLRLLCNAFVHPAGETAVLKHHERILDSLICLRDANKNVQVAAATLMLNLSVAMKNGDTVLLCQCLLQILNGLNDIEAEFRAFVALGTLLENAARKSDLVGVMVSHDGAIGKLKSYGDSPTTGADPNKLKTIKCCKEVIRLL